MQNAADEKMLSQNVEVSIRPRKINISSYEKWIKANERLFPSIKRNYSGKGRSPIRNIDQIKVHTNTPIRIGHKMKLLYFL